MMGFILGWAWERRKQKKIAGRVAELTDPFLGDRELEQAADQLAAGNWAPLEALISHRADPVEVRHVALMSDVPLPAVQTWAQTQNSSVAYQNLALAQIRDGWAIRGSGRAKTVAEGAWVDFHDYLQAAEQSCGRAIELDPSDDGAWVPLLTTARGLGTPKDELRFRFQQVHERRPFSWDACTQMLQGLCAKWGGSDNDMFEFARWIQQEAPADAPARGQIGKAHQEMQLNNKGWLKRPEVQKEMTVALAAYLDATPPKATVGQVHALNQMLASLLPTDASSALVATEAMRRIDNRASDSAWALVGGVPEFVKRSDQWEKKLPKLMKKG